MGAGLDVLTGRFAQEHKRSLWNPKQLTSNIDRLILRDNNISTSVQKSTDAFLKVQPDRQRRPALHLGVHDDRARDAGLVGDEHHGGLEADAGEPAEPEPELDRAGPLPQRAARG